MSTMKVTGLDELVNKMQNFTADSDMVIDKCLEKGIGVVTDQMAVKLNSIQVSEQASGKNHQKQRLARQWEKDALLAEKGYSPIQWKGATADRKAGFDGYVTKPSGKQVAVRAIANSINAGTSFMKKQPLFAPVVRSARTGAMEAMEAEMKVELKKHGLT